MEIIELFEKVISDANYAGEFNFGDLIELIKNEGYDALSVQSEGKNTCVLIFVNGEGEGAIQVDEFGMMFGDKVLYNINKRGLFKLFLIDKKLAESISSRCRIYEKSHLMDDTKTQDLPEIQKFSIQPAKMKIMITSDGEPAEGLKVRLRREGESGVFDTTSDEGYVSFLLPKGKYYCVITQTDKKEHNFEIIHQGRDAVFNLEI